MNPLNSNPLMDWLTRSFSVTPSPAPKPQELISPADTALISPPYSAPIDALPPLSFPSSFLAEPTYAWQRDAYNPAAWDGRNRLAIAAENERRELVGLHASYARLLHDISESKPKTDYTREPEPAPPTVEEIHRAFETEAERAVEEAKSILSRATDAIAGRLSKLGFAKHPRVQEHSKTIAPIERDLDAEPNIAHYKAKYGKPFILRHQAERLAQKYGLVLGRVSEFIGNVPEQNVAEIERFLEKFDRAEDAAYGQRNMWGGFAEDAFLAAPRLTIDVENDTMMIVAPLRDFDMKSTRAHVNERGVMVNDPIVLYPAAGGYIVVTAWGDEANDPLLKQ